VGDKLWKDWEDAKFKGVFYSSCKVLPRMISNYPSGEADGPFSKPLPRSPMDLGD